MNISTTNTLNVDKNVNFGSLKKIKCRTKIMYDLERCGFYEERVVKQLEKVAKKNKFFKDYDVDAFVSVERDKGALLTMQCKPAAKTLKDKIKNFFSSGEKISVKKDFKCPDDSSFHLALDLKEDGNYLYDLLKKKKN